MAKTKYIVLDKEFEIQKIFNTRKSATRYAETLLKLINNTCFGKI